MEVLQHLAGPGFKVWTDVQGRELRVALFIEGNLHFLEQPQEELNTQRLASRIYRVADLFKRLIEALEVKLRLLYPQFATLACNYFYRLVESHGGDIRWPDLVIDGGALVTHFLLITIDRHVFEAISLVLPSRRHSSERTELALCYLPGYLNQEPFDLCLKLGIERQHCY